MAAANPSARGHRFQDLTGQTFGRWTVLCFVDVKPTRWLCHCDCGVERVVKAKSLRDGDSRSCGCLSRERASKRATKHGGSAAAEYRVWCGIKTRCTNPKASNYKYYGGRGITICQRWLESFAAFLEDMGLKPSDSHTIERIDNSKGYEPSNCRWATMVEQGANMSRNRHLTYKGETLTMTQWARRLGVSLQTLAYRVGRGWSDEEVLGTPIAR
jgi:hypothetical protein